MKPPEDIVLLGGGEHAKVLAEAIQLQPERWRLIAVVDPNNSALAMRRKVRAFRDDREVLPLLDGCRLILGVGQRRADQVRQRIVERLEPHGARWATLIHPAATISPSASIEEGTAVLAGAIVQADARIGRHVVVNTAAVIEHDVTVEDFAMVAPGVLIGGGACVSANAFLGIGCRIRDHARIGHAATVAMGAVVVRDVPDGACVSGVPALEHRPASS